MENKIIKTFEMFGNEVEGERDSTEAVKNITDLVDTKLLKSIPDERQSIDEGDIVIATYFMGGFDTYEFQVEHSPINDKSLDRKRHSLESLGASDGQSWYSLEAAYHVIKKSTYEKKVFKHSAKPLGFSNPRDMIKNNESRKHLKKFHFLIENSRWDILRGSQVKNIKLKGNKFILKTDTITLYISSEGEGHIDYGFSGRDILSLIGYNVEDIQRVDPYTVYLKFSNGQSLNVFDATGYSGIKIWFDSDYPENPESEINFIDWLKERKLALKNGISKKELGKLNEIEKAYQQYLEETGNKV